MGKLPYGRFWPIVRIRNLAEKRPLPETTVSEKVPYQEFHYISAIGHDLPFKIFAHDGRLLRVLAY